MPCPPTAEASLSGQAQADPLFLWGDFSGRKVPGPQTMLSCESAMLYFITGSS